MYRDNQIEVIYRKLSNKLLSRPLAFVYVGIVILIIMLIVSVKLVQSNHSSTLGYTSKLSLSSTTIPIQNQVSNTTDLPQSNISIQNSSDGSAGSNSSSTSTDQSTNDSSNSQTTESIQSTTTSSSSNPGETQSNVEVNGKNINVAPNTDYSKTTISHSGVSSLYVSNQTNKSGTSSSMDVQINSSSVSE